MLILQRCDLILVCDIGFGYPGCKEVHFDPGHLQFMLLLGCFQCFGIAGILDLQICISLVFGCYRIVADLLASAGAVGGHGCDLFVQLLLGLCCSLLLLHETILKIIFECGAFVCRQTVKFQALLKGVDFQLQDLFVQILFRLDHAAVVVFLQFGAGCQEVLILGK